MLFSCTNPQKTVYCIQKAQKDTKMQLEKFEQGDLMLINILPLNEEDETHGHDGLGWRKALVKRAAPAVAPFYAADYHRTTGGDRDGISVLIQCDDYEHWDACAEEFGCKIAPALMRVTAGEYGDFDRIVEIFETANSCDLLWYENI